MPDPDESYEDYFEDDEDPAGVFAAFDAGVTENVETVQAEPRYV